MPIPISYIAYGRQYRMSQSAAEIIDAILLREGSEYTNNPADKGGPTKWGITQATLSRYLQHPASETEVQTMTRDMACEIYQRLYVAPFTVLAAISPRLLGLLVDSAVQHGTVRAAAWLQEVIGATPQDGILGPASLERWRPYRLGTRDQDEAYKALLKTRIRFYAKIIHDNPTQATFANGWFARVCEFI